MPNSPDKVVKGCKRSIPNLAGGVSSRIEGSIFRYSSKSLESMILDEKVKAAKDIRVHTSKVESSIVSSSICRHSLHDLLCL
jgi:hypothetical protein